MWDATAQLYATGSSADLGQYAHDKALADINDTAFYYQQHNIIVKGQPVLSPRVASISAGIQPYRAAITDCIDSTHFVEVDKSTGKAVPLLDKSQRHVVTAHAQTLSGRWVIMNFTISRNQTC
jgi:hypothetical protein